MFPTPQVYNGYENDIHEHDMDDASDEFFPQEAYLLVFYVVILGAT
jgi:hypothetical protein